MRQLRDGHEIGCNYSSARAPAGYTLGSFSFYIDQTVGGAVATGEAYYYPSDRNLPHDACEQVQSRVLCSVSAYTEAFTLPAAGALVGVIMLLCP